VPLIKENLLTESGGLDFSDGGKPPNFLPFATPRPFLSRGLAKTDCLYSNILQKFKGFSRKNTAQAHFFGSYAGLLNPLCLFF
jgi:hypothetical protein